MLDNIIKKYMFEKPRQYSRFEEIPKESVITLFRCFMLGINDSQALASITGIDVEFLNKMEESNAQYAVLKKQARDVSKTELLSALMEGGLGGNFQELRAALYYFLNININVPENEKQLGNNDEFDQMIYEKFKRSLNSDSEKIVDKIIEK